MNKQTVSPSHQANIVPSPVNGVVAPLEHRIKPGEVRNPKGRPAAGAVVVEWVDAMAGWTKGEIERVRDDAKATAAKLTAARCWLHAMSFDVNAAGNPIAGADTDRIMDRTLGKALRRAEHHHLHLHANMDMTRLNDVELGELQRLISKACPTLANIEQGDELPGPEGGAQ